MQIGFADPTQTVPMPDLFTLGDPLRNLLPAHSPGCQAEDQIGIASFPFFAAAATGMVDSFTVRDLQTVVDGPAYVQLLTRWARPFACGNPAVASVASGETRWGFFPDGRIVRNDSALGSSVPINLRDCTVPAQRCVSGDTYLLTSYFSFAHDEVAGVAVLPSTTEAAPPMTQTPNGNTQAIQQGGCVAAAAGGRLALRWDAFSNVQDTRFRNVPAAEDQLVFVADMYEEQTSSPTPINVPTTVHSVRTTLVMDASGATACGALQNRAAAVAIQQPVSISDATRSNVQVPFDLQQVYSADATPFASEVTVRTDAGVIGGGFVISLAMPGTRIRTNRDAAAVIWHHAPAEGRFYLWFRDELTTAEPIVITSGC